MKLKALYTAAVFLLTATAVTAQTVVTNVGGQSKLFKDKSSSSISVFAGGTHYFFTKYTKSAVPTFYMQSFDQGGKIVGQKDLEIPTGVFNDTYFIDKVVGLGDRLYALVQNLSKTKGANTLYAREVSPNGTVATEEVEVVKVNFEKMMNSGFHFAAVSQDKKTLAVVGELPYEKEVSTKMKIALFDAELKQLSENEITLPGEGSKNKQIEVFVANDGTVYILKRMFNKIGEIVLTVYQYSANSPKDIKEYVIETTAPEYVSSYVSEVNAANEFVVSGTTYIRKTMTVGDKQASGVFYFTNKGKSEAIMKTMALDAPVDNLTAQKVLINGTTVFLTAQQFKMERIDPTNPSTFDYNYNYTHKAEYIIAMDLEGNKKFQLNLTKDFKAYNFNKQYESAYFICNDKLTIVYNDLTSNYVPVQSSSYANVLPVLVQITNDGLLQSPIAFIDAMKLPYGFILNPSISVQDTPNGWAFLMSSHEFVQYIHMTID